MSRSFQTQRGANWIDKKGNDASLTNNPEPLEGRFLRPTRRTSWLVERNNFYLAAAVQQEYP